MTRPIRYRRSDLRPGPVGGRPDRRRPVLVLLWVAALCLFTAAATGQPASPRPLAVGRALEAPIGSGETHVYQLALDATRHWYVTLDQSDCDLTLTAVAADGPSHEVQDPLAGVGRLSLLLSPPMASEWSLRITATAYSGEGAYRLLVEELEDGERLVAAAATSFGGQIFRPDDRDAKLRARDEFARAADLWRRADDDRELARALHRAGSLSRSLNDPVAAVRFLEEAVALWRRLGEAADEADAGNSLGLLRWHGGEPEQAKLAFQRALEVSRVLETRRLEVISRNNLCFLVHSQGSLEEARTCYEAALPLVEEAGQEATLAAILNNLGGVHHELGEPSLAGAYFARALALHRGAGNRGGEASVLNNLAALHRAVGDYEQALLDYESALEIVREQGDRRQEGRVLNNLGYAYRVLGELDLAGSYLRQALALRREVGDRRGEAATLSNLGRLRQDDGDLTAAREHYSQALATYRELGIRRSEGLTLDRLGSVLIEEGRAEEALQHLDAAVAALTEVGDPRSLSQALRSRSEALAALGRSEQARAAAAAALPLARHAGDRVKEARALLMLARLDDAEGDLVAASDHGEAAVAVLEGLRSSLVTPDLRASFLASYRQAYELLIDLAMRQGRVERALEVAERASARTLLDQVLEIAGDLPREVDPELGAERHDLEGRLRLLADRRLRVDGEAQAGSAAELDAALNDLLARLDGVEARIRRLSPQYADLTRPPLLDVAGMQRLLDADTLLLRFSLGERRSYLWRVTEEVVEGYELPSRQSLEELARQAHRELFTRGASPHPQLAELARVLLAPVAGRLDRRRLLLIVDGALNYVPFAALPAPGGDGEPLLVAHEVVSVPSMSVLAVQRRTLASRRPTTHTLAVLADPVFHGADQRLGVAARPAALVRGSDFGRLRFSRREAHAIADLVAPGDRFVALDFAASRGTALSDALASYRIVHFATHGVLDARHPELSALVLSQVDEAGRRVEGLLGLRDLYRLHLGADLVVLSGCRTALGRELSGEGLVGLTRGFLYAGVPRVVASLWQVDDRATAELMTELYRALLNDRSGPAVALRQAQLALYAEARTRDPFFWAAFVLQGDWRPAVETASPGGPPRLAHRLR